MFKYLFVFICSFSLFISDEIFYPMKKDSKLGEHICLYTEKLENHDTKTYVKPCKEGKYCSNTSSGIFTSGTSGTSFNYFICKNLTNRFSIKVYNKECESKFDLDTGLDCDNGRYTISCSDSSWKPYETNGSLSWDCKSPESSKESLNYFYNEFVNDNSLTCKPGEIYEITPDYLKVQGILNIKGYFPNAGEDDKGQLYRKISIESSYKRYFR